MIVLDASAAVEIVQNTEMGWALQELALTNEKKITCELMRAETASVFRKLVRMKAVDADTADRFLAEATALPDEYYPLDDLQSSPSDDSS